MKEIIEIDGLFSCHLKVFFTRNYVFSFSLCFISTKFIWISIQLKRSIRSCSLPDPSGHPARTSDLHSNLYFGRFHLTWITFMVDIKGKLDFVK